MQHSIAGSFSKPGAVQPSTTVTAAARMRSVLGTGLAAPRP
ncbi:hypothetical protein AB0B31_33310 [Catellatospora citrea]